MKILKQILINSATTIVTILIIGSAYAAISTVSSGDPLTADSWNSIVNKLNNTDTNSTDLVTKSYVDSIISANSWNTSGSIDWSDCTTSYAREQSYFNTELTCNSWYVLVDHSCIWNNDSNWSCYLSWVNSLLVKWWSSSSDSSTMWSIKCCKLNP